MTNAPSPPKLAENIIHFCAGPYLCEDICGDLQERFNRSPSEIWYWGQVMRSIPTLCFMHIRNLSRQAYVNEGLFVTLTLLFVWVWELGIARKISWPMAQLILDYSPLTPVESCQAMYVLLYGMLVLVGISVVKIWAHYSGRSLHFKRTHILFFGFLTSAIAIYLYMNPGPYDGNRYFRIYQLLLIWAVTAWLFLDPPPIRKRQTIVP